MTYYAYRMNDVCHHCGYELTGLADRGHCPECGKPYDKHSVYRGQQATEPPFMRHMRWAGLAAFALMVLMCGGFLSFKSGWSVGVIGLTLVVAGVAGFGSYVYWSTERQEKRESE